MRVELSNAVVRSWEPADATSMAKHADNRAIWLNLRDRFPHPYTRNHAVAFIRRVQANRPETTFCIEVDGEAAGGIGFMLQQDIERVSAEVGYWLGEPFWGRGIGTGVLRAVTAYAMTAHGLTRLFAVPFADNLPSCRVLEKAGYVLEGVMRRSAIKDGRIRDQKLYAFVGPEP
ncbi:MAG: GNAT family N-acetyltransferase [Acidobacteria bacterium]|nr:GNAT family N-acetyltransferase [Acidobacteriota bacterium]